MKLKLPMLALMCVLGAAVALMLVGCAEEPDVTTETVDELPEAAGEVYTDEPEDPGQETAPGVDVEEMETDTPPHVREDEMEEEPQGTTEPGMESDGLDPIETGPEGGGVDVEEMTTDTPPPVREDEE